MSTKDRLTLSTPTHFILPISIYNTLEDDAYYFGFIKNKRPSLSGLLNHLIPNLADYRNDLHLSFLEKNKGDAILTNKIEENIYKTYFSKYDYCDDATVSVSFRVNSEHMQQFLDIYDNVLHKYNMNFTEFIRSVLIEYASKRLNQREYFFYYKEMFKIKEAISNHQQCTFYLENEKISFIPISIELSRVREENLIIGYNFLTEEAYVVPISVVRRVIMNDIKYEVTNEDVDFAYEYFKEYENNIKGEE